MSVTYRPMTVDDACTALGLARVTFTELDAREGRPADWPADDTPLLVRHRHLAATDPGGVWIAESDGRAVGCAVAILREGLWGLSLLVVHPDHQSRGIGAELLRRALAYGDQARGGIILSSADSRAMRVYARAGFAVRPCLAVRGAIRNAPRRPARVREGRWPQDRPLLDDASRAVRTAAHGEDVGAMLEAGCRLLVCDDGGFAVVIQGELKLLAARDEAVAADLMAAAIAESDGSFEAQYLGARHDWAISIALDAGLELQPWGPIFTRGDVGPLAPYVPNGAYL